MDGKNLKDALEFIEKIRFIPSSSTKNLFYSFSQAFSNFRKGICEIDELDRQIFSILEDYPDLLNDYLSFRKDFDSNSGFRYVLPQRDPRFSKLLKRCTKSEQRVEVLKPWFAYVKIGKVGFWNKIEILEKRIAEVVLKDEFGFPLEKTESKKLEKKLSKRSPRTSVWGNSTSSPELTFSSGEQTERKRKRKVRRSLEAELGSKTAEETMMEEFEDSMFELDMMLSKAQNTANFLEELQLIPYIEDLRKYLNGMQMRCIQMLCSSASDNLLEHYYRNPEVGLPVLVLQLRRKERELWEQKRNFKCPRL